MVRALPSLLLISQTATMPAAARDHDEQRLWAAQVVAEVVGLEVVPNHDHVRTRPSEQGENAAHRNPLRHLEIDPHVKRYEIGIP